ncbi:hypothetical protein ACFU9X_19180 [Streptomyces atratus]
MTRAKSRAGATHGRASDYSRGTNTAYADASGIAVHAGGTLSWGTAP